MKPPSAPACVAAHFLKETLGERIVDVLDGVHAEAVESERVEGPPAPVEQFVGNLGIVDVDIVAHQVIVVAVLLVDTLAPAFARADDAEDALVAGKVVVVDACEMLPVPFERRILVAAALELEVGEGLYLARLADILQTVAGVDGLGHESLGGVAVHAVVEYCVEDHLDAVFVQRPDRILEFGARAVFGGDCPLLVELAEIVEVIDRIADILDAAALVGRRNPDGRHAYLREVGGVARELVP